MENLFSVVLCDSPGPEYLIIDAFDEADSRQRFRLIKTLCSIPQKLVKVFMTCRPHLKDAIASKINCGHMNIRAHPSDIRLYLSQRTAESNLADLSSEDFESEIINTLVDHANDM